MQAITDFVELEYSINAAANAAAAFKTKFGKKCSLLEGIWLEKEVFFQKEIARLYN